MASLDEILQKVIAAELLKLRQEILQYVTYLITATIDQRLKSYEEQHLRAEADSFDQPAVPARTLTGRHADRSDAEFRGPVDARPEVNECDVTHEHVVLTTAEAPKYSMRAEHAGRTFSNSPVLGAYHSFGSTHRDNVVSTDGKLELTSLCRHWKSALCKHWESGGCFRGDRCTFAHGEHEIRNAKYKASLCDFWTKGNCKNGEACSFAHGQHELVHRADFALDKQNTPHASSSQSFSFRSLSQSQEPPLPTQAQAKLESLAQSLDTRPPSSVSSALSAAAESFRASSTSFAPSESMQLAAQDFNADDYNQTGMGTYLFVTKNATRLQRLQDDANDADWQMAKCDSGREGWVPAYCFERRGQKVH